MHGALHNIYVTPEEYLGDGLTSKSGSSFAVVLDLSSQVVPAKVSPSPAVSATHCSSTLRTSSFLREVVSQLHRPKALLSAGEAAGPSHGIGVAPDGKTLWVTSIPQNAVFAYSLADLSLVGQVALPELELPGRSPGGAVPNWVTFPPDRGTVYISNAGLARSRRLMISVRAVNWSSASHGP